MARSLATPATFHSSEARPHCLVGCGMTELHDTSAAVETNGMRYAHWLRFLPLVQVVFVVAGVLLIFGGLGGYGWATAKEKSLLEQEEFETKHLFRKNAMSVRVQPGGVIAPAVPNHASLALLEQARIFNHRRILFQYVVACGFVPIIVATGLHYAAPRWARTPVHITNEWLQSENRYGEPELEAGSQDLDVGDTATKLADMARKWRTTSE